MKYQLDFQRFKQFIVIMSQFLDYISTMLTGKMVEQNEKQPAKSNHVTFAENSFTQAFSRNDAEKAAKFALLSQTNRNTILIYQCVGAVAFIAHLFMVTFPQIKKDNFDMLTPDAWQHITLAAVPVVVYLASVGAMIEVNKPISEATKLTAKNSDLDLNANNFVHSLKIIILLMAMCQISSIFSHHLIWSVVMIIPLWCYQLTTKVARIEYDRYAPSPKRQWPINIAKSPKSPKPATPSKRTQPKTSAIKLDDPARATPRTRTRRAVKNIITGVTDKYHAFEQNVAHQLTQKIFTSPGTKLKMIE